MITMQYSFTLPADYDMEMIDRRVREKGNALDDYAPLLFKVYLAARRGDPVTQGPENLYAPFYVWQDERGMTEFLCGPGFQGLVHSFGWPSVRTWPNILVTESRSGLDEARYAVREFGTIAPFADLDAIRQREIERVRILIQEPTVLFALSAFEPTNWTLVRFTLRTDLPATLSVGTTAYEVLHVSNPTHI